MLSRPDSGERRLPALDGLRAVAVGLVMAYHGGIPGLSTAGFFGVDVFFVLSGFLITTLLLEEAAGAGRIRFAAFWGRRARRLLPGLLVMLAVVDLYVVFLAPSGRYPTFRGDAFSVLAYVSNWHFVAASSDYFAATGFPSLLTHTWSLAIEEQFYLLWPLALWAAVRLGRRTGRRPASIVAVMSGAGALASAAWMAALYRGGASPSRLYYGTDTHAQSLLVGAALAGLAALRPDFLGRLPATAVAVLAASGLGWAAVTLGSSDPSTYQGGFLLVALLAAALIAVMVGRGDRLPARALAAAPLVYFGRISYGMYLWYFPLFEVVDHGSTGLVGLPLFALRCVIDVALAAASFHLLEQPVRRWLGRPHRRPALRLAPLAVGAGTLVGVGGLVAADTPAAFPLAVSAATPFAAPQLGGQSASGYDSPAGFDQGGPGAAAARPLTVLVVGDSTALTLAADLYSVGTQFGLVVDDGAILGCGVVVSAAYRDHGVVHTPAQPCNAASPPERQWPAQLRQELAEYRPDVVLVVAGRWDTKDRRAADSSPWTTITSPAGASYVRSQLDLAASIPISEGIPVALATSPCFASGEQPDGSPWPEDDPRRVAAYNDQVRAVVAAHRGRASVVDLHAMVCPGGHYRQVVDGVTVRAPDGVHYPRFDVRTPYVPSPNTMAEAEAFGRWIAPQILAPLRSLVSG